MIVSALLHAGIDLVLRLMEARSVLRYKRDLLPVIFTLSISVIQFTLFFFVEPVWVVLAAVLVIFPFQCSAIAVNHNHHHLNTFTGRGLNRVFESLLYFQTGASPYSWTLHHNIGHHKHYLDQAQDTSRWKKKDGRVMRRLEYSVFNSIMIYPEIVRVGRQYPKIFKKFVRMFMINNIVLLALIVLDPLKALIIFILPMLVMLYLLVDATYGHHAGLDTDDPFEASTNKLSKFYNLRTFNLGYHTAHHLKPGVHWTKLPALHVEIEDKIPEALISGS